MLHSSLLTTTMSSDSDEDFASTSSEATNISSIASETSLGTADDESIGSTIPFDPNRSPAATTTAVPEETDKALVALLLSPDQDNVSFATFCNADKVKFGKANSKARKAVQNRKAVLKRLQSNQPIQFAKIAAHFGLINSLPSSHPPVIAAARLSAASSPPSTPRRRVQTPRSTKTTSTPSSEKKKKARRPSSNIRVVDAAPSTMSECKLYHHPFFCQLLDSCMPSSNISLPLSNVSILPNVRLSL